MILNKTYLSLRWCQSGEVSHLLHDFEVTAHGICHASHEAKLRDKLNNALSLVLGDPTNLWPVDQQRLIWIIDFDAVLRFVVSKEGSLDTICQGELGLGRFVEVNPIDFVAFVVVPGNDSLS